VTYGKCRRVNNSEKMRPANNTKKKGNSSVMDTLPLSVTNTAAKRTFPQTTIEGRGTKKLPEGV